MCVLPSEKFSRQVLYLCAEEMRREADEVQWIQREEESGDETPVG